MEKKQTASKTALEAINVWLAVHLEKKPF